MIARPTEVRARREHHNLRGQRSHQAAEQLLERQIQSSLLRQMPTSGQRLEVAFDALTGALVLSGRVRTFYAKQALYHACRKLAGGYVVVDSLIVDDIVPPPCWAGGLYD